MAPKAPKRPTLTHFLCVPLVTASSAPAWRTSLEQFAKDATSVAVGPDLHGPRSAVVGSTVGSDVTADPPVSPALPKTVVPQKAVRPLHSIHLTLGVMSLPDQSRVEEAQKMLESLDLKALLNSAGDEADDPAPSPLRLTLRSLHAMQAPQRTSVLYAAPDATLAPPSAPASASSPSSSSSPSSPDRALRFCTLVRDAFAAHSLLVPDERPLKLHATLVNTLHARPRPGKDRRAKAKARAAKLPDGWGRPKRAGEEPTGVARASAAISTTGESGERSGQGGGGEGGEEMDEIGGTATAETGMGTGTEVAEMDGDGKVDARWLIERWRDHVWAEVTVEKVAICEMGAKDDGNGEMRYKEIAVRML